MTKEILNRLPETIRLHIDELKKNYNNPNINLNVSRAGSIQYLTGLMDAGLITEVEKRTLFCYTTI